MKLSTKGRYGLTAILDLAIHGGSGQVSLNSIADRQNLSENYLEQLFASLRKAGLVKSIRGSQGGYVLARTSAEITVGEIIRALEGSLAPVECVTENADPGCSRADICVTRVVWEKIRDGINSVVDSITLEQLVDMYGKNKNSGTMYYI